MIEVGIVPRGEWVDEYRARAAANSVRVF